MSRIWTNELELTFLEYIQAEPVLWNINLRDYKNKLKNHDAWKRISTLMEVPISELKTKKNSLLASYRTYKNKVKKSEKSGAGVDDIYQPIWFAYEYMDSFLGDTVLCKNTRNTVTQSTKHVEDHEEEIGLQKDQSEPSLDTNATPVLTIRRRNHPTDLLAATKVLTDALSSFNDTFKNKESRSTPIIEDDCDLYAKLLAKKLRRLPEDIRLRLMFSIDRLFLSSEYSEPSSQISTTVSPKPQHSNQVIASSEPIQNSNAYCRYPNVIIESSDDFYPPVIHILEDTDTNTELMINEDTDVPTNIIEQAFLIS